MKLFKRLFLLFLFPIAAKAQNNFTNINAVANQLVKNIRSIGTEKIILQTNKKIYAPEETILFKAFEIDSVTGRLKNTSKILFADLVDDNDKVIHHLTLNLETAQQVGAFLPDSSLGGFYWIRAYIKNILNQNINNIALKPVYILTGNKNAINKFNSAEISTATEHKTPLLSFYPEGGELISGAPSLVAVKLRDNKGKGFTDSGFIKDNRNNIITRFSTNTDGLGKFIFEPSSYRKYSVFLFKDNHYDSIANLPVINPFAAQVSVTEQTAQSLKARVLLEDSIYKKDYRTFLIGLHKDSICIAAEGQGNYEFNIPLSNFPAGIASLLLYNADGRLLSERNIYINKNDISITMQTDKNNYAAREKVNMNITITDKNKPVLAALSVAVNDSRVNDSVNNFCSDTLANLSVMDADLVMLVEQKQNVYSQNTYSLKSNNLNGDKNNSLYINGMLFNKKKAPASNKSIMLISNNQNGLILQDTTNSQGKFSFELASFNTGTPFSMQVNGEHAAQDNYNIVLDSAIHFDFTTPSFLKEKFSPEQLQNLRKTESFYMNSIVAGKQWLPEVKVSGTFNTKKTNAVPDVIISKEILHSGRVNNVGDAILQFSKFHVIGGYLMSGGANGFAPATSDEPIIVMDGAQISTKGYNTVLAFLKTISTSGVDHIRILTGASASGYGLISGTGVIEIFTASNSTNQTNLPGGLQTIYPKGFDTTAEFKIPDYSDKHIKNSKMDDSRTSVYWNGDIITDENGSANISFFTADTPAVYIVTISGITANGVRIYKTFTLSRK